MPFDLTDLHRSVRFDLERGAVHAGSDVDAAGHDLAEDSSRGSPIGGDGRAVLLPEDALFDLCAAAGPDVAASVGREMGHTIGLRVVRRIGARGAEGVREAKLPSVVAAMALELGIVGLGAFAVERWGKALVLSLEHPPRLGGVFIASLLAGALSAASGTEVVCVPLSADPKLRLFVSNADAVDRVRGLIGEGIPFAEALYRVQSPNTPSRGGA